MRISDWSVKARIAGLSVAAMVALAVVIAVFIGGNVMLGIAQVRADRFDAITLAVRDLRIAALEMRRAEKDFLLRNETRYADAAKTATESASAVVAQLGKLDQEGTLRGQLGTLGSGLDAYGKALQQLVTERTRMA